MTNEYRVTDGAGGWRHLAVRAVPIVSGGEVVEWVGTGTDVTEQVEAARRVALLQDVSTGLASALTVADVVDVVLERGAAALGATGAEVRLREDGAPSMRTVRAHGDADGPGGASAASLSLPLATTGAPFGTLDLRFAPERVLDEDDHADLTALATLAAQAIERARLYERERSAAELLQRSLLPAALPEVPGVALAARYQPGTDGLQVGGDWYDAVPLADGRLLVSVGDVIGKGPRAAALMGQVRTAVRAYAALHTSPAAILEDLDHLAPGLGEDVLVTLALLALDPASGEVSLARAGHLPPVELPADGPVTLLGSGGGGVPLGVDGPRREVTATLAPGTVLVLCTDGLVEGRHRGLDEGLAALADVLRAAPRHDLEALCDRVVGTLTAGGVEDDLTLLALRWDGPGA